MSSTTPYNTSNLAIYSPALIPGLSLWFDAADPTTVNKSGSSVTQWNDKSGNGYNATVTGSTSYITNSLNGLNGIQISGTTQSITTPSFVLSPTSQVAGFVVAKAVTVNNNTNLLMSTSSYQNYSQYVNGSSNSDYAGYLGGSNTLIDSGHVITNGSIYIYELTFDGANGAIFLNGLQYATFSRTPGTSLTTSQPLVINHGGSAVFVIYEVLFFSSFINPSQRQQIEGYLAWKWGLQTQLQLAFLPPQISGCSLWLDAADSTTIVQSTGSVSQWNDKSGNGYNATATSGHYPTVHSKGQNGLNTLTFDGATQYLQFANSNVLDFNTNDFAVFAAVQFNLNGVTQTFIGKTSTGFPQWRLGTEANNYMVLTIYNSSGAGATSQGPAISGWGFVSGMVYRSTGDILYLNGTGQPSGGTITGSLSTTAITTIGNLTPSSARYWAADMGEIIVYTGTLTTSQRQLIEGYLAWKWGLQASLPSSHPYYYNNPTVTHPFYNQPYLPNTVVNPYLGLNPISATLPNNLSGLALWLDAADATTVIRSGSNVTRWNDKSGNNRYAYASAAINYPQFTGNSVYFPPYQASVTDAQLIFNNYITDNARIDMFIVSKPFNTTQTGTFRTLIKGLNLGTHVIILNTGTTQVGLYYGGMIQFGSLTIDGSARCLLYVSINASYQYTASINGSLTLSAPTSATAKEYIQYFGNASQGGQPWGDINEFIVYNNTLTTSQRQQVEGYLAWKWGLQGNLPSSHPSAGPSVLNVRYAISPYQWLPNNISGLSLWLDAADSSTVIRSGSNVTNVRDKSPNNYILSNATGFTYVNNIFNGKYPSLYNSNNLTNYNLGSNANFILNQPFTAFFIGMKITSTNYYDGMIFDGLVNISNRVAWYGGTYTMYASNSLAHANTSNLINVPILATGFFNTSNSILYINGSQDVTGNIGTNNNLNGTIIGNNWTTNSPWIGHFCELIIYSNVLTTNQRQQIEGYLAWKWGLQKNLPISHPYYLFPPG
jgi:hypothetical protein